ncbi:MAG: c-type cytochrome domain-containing protein [Rhodocyclaceae bacterium]
MLKNKTVLLAACVGTLFLAGCSERGVSFSGDVMPILKKNCLECHNPAGKGFAASGLLLDSYENVMKGTKHGPVVKPGNGLASPFNQVLEGRVDKSIRMPHGGAPIPEDAIKTLRAWVDQGAKNN